MLFLRWNVLHLKAFADDLFSNKREVQLHEFQSSMKDWIIRQCHSAQVVTINGGSQEQKY